MGAIVSQITSLTIVYSTVYSDADQRKHQSAGNTPMTRTKDQYRGKYFHLMASPWVTSKNTDKYITCSHNEVAHNNTICTPFIRYTVSKMELLICWLARPAAIMHNVSQNLRLGRKDGKGPVYGARSHHKHKDCKPGYWTIWSAAREPETIKLYQGFMVLVISTEFTSNRVKTLGSTSIRHRFDECIHNPVTTCFNITSRFIQCNSDKV